MILQALTEYYETILKLPTNKQSPPRFGWSQTNVRFAVSIDLSGALKEIILLANDANKKGRPTTVPMQLKRSGTKPPPYFLCDTSAYVLGIDKGEITTRSKTYFALFSSYNKSILSHINCPEAHAVTKFLDNWDVESALDNPIIQDALPYDLGKGNLTFYIADSGTWVLDNTIIQDSWNEYYQKSRSQGNLGICLVTGKDAPIARIHNSVKGIYASSLSPNGWTLVGIDKGSPAFSSYGKEQGYNAPTSEYAAFAYTTALNHLLADREHVCRVGDATVVCWAREGQDAYTSLFNTFAFDAPSAYSFSDIQGMVKSLCDGNPVNYDSEQLDPNMDFYILGLSPNAARLSVRFFLRNTFGNFLRNIQAHQDRLEIVRPTYDKFEALPVWKLLSETVNQNSRDKSPAPDLAGEVLRAILNNTLYPATLLFGVTLRIRAEREITRGRAAIIKAYYKQLADKTKHENPDIPEEVLRVSLNENSSNIPYNLGRLFSVLEAIQAAANPGINATVKDKYFNSAAATPAVIFPTLVNLAQKHLRKLKGSNAGLVTFYDKQLTELSSHIGESYPTRMSLPQQGSFQLGYYHQTQARYQKKEEK